MDYSNSNDQQSPTESENKPSVLGGMWDGLKNSFSGSAPLFQQLEN